ncbi:MAG TPA: YdcF family protein [Candidatus Acidoferrales bacterium]|nr:YdcF family protein [Candidatus Acidoferrales bacterium]
MNPPSSANSCRSRQRGGIILKLIKWIVILAVLATLYLLRAPILRAAGGFWVVEDSPEKADAIIILGDDNYQADRATRAAELYRAGWAPRVVASGRFLRPYASVPELMQHDLSERGVPAGAIVRMPSFARNTREEAVVLRRLADRQHWRRVLVVTSNFHTRRARHIFVRVFRDSADVRVIAARDSGYDPADWWRSRSGIKAFFLELGGYPVAIWETRSAESAQRGLRESVALPNVPQQPTTAAPPASAPR